MDMGMPDPTGGRPVYPTAEQNASADIATVPSGAVAAETETGAMPGMDHGSMAGMDHGSMSGMSGQSSGAMPGMDHGAMAGMQSGSMAGMDMSGMDMGDMSMRDFRSEEHTSELQSLMRISYAVFCLKKNNN